MTEKRPELISQFQIAISKQFDTMPAEGLTKNSALIDASPMDERLNHCECGHTAHSSHTSSSKRLVY